MLCSVLLHVFKTLLVKNSEGILQPPLWLYRISRVHEHTNIGFFLPPSSFLPPLFLYSFIPLFRDACTQPAPRGPRGRRQGTWLLPIYMICYMVSHDILCGFGLTNRGPRGRHTTMSIHPLSFIYTLYIHPLYTLYIPFIYTLYIHPLYTLYIHPLYTPFIHPWMTYDTYASR